VFATIVVADDGSALCGSAVRAARTLLHVTGAGLVTDTTRDPRLLRRSADRAGADLLVAPATAHPESLVDGSPCAVLLVPMGADATRLARIGVAGDGSASSRAAAAFAHAFAALPGSPVRQLDLVRVGPGTEVDRLAREPGARARVRAVHAAGEPVPELLARASRWDLLVMGSRSRGPLRRLALGSTSAEVARRARCLVLILPRVPHADPEDRDRSGFEERVAEAMRERRR
jgi:nucleotide-binding universal stress UspA family protein